MLIWGHKENSLVSQGREVGKRTQGKMTALGEKGLHQREKAASGKGKGMLKKKRKI